MIKEIEASIIDRAFEEGWVLPAPPLYRTGKKVANIGSGPAGLAAADELNKFGHLVTVFERADRIGGLLTYGIPNMKLDKGIVERRVNLLAEEGILFKTNVNAGVDISAADLQDAFDAIVLCAGAPIPRDLAIEGRELNGIHYAMNLLTANTKKVLDQPLSDDVFLDLKDKNVIVIGGGDTGTDCIATSIRLGCRSVTQFELMPPFPERSLNHDDWLNRGRTFQVDYAQEEAITLFGADPRQYEILTKRFMGDEQNNLTGLETVCVNWIERNGKNILREIPGTERVWKADVVFLAMGFSGAEKGKLPEDLGVEFTNRGTIYTKGNKQTNIPNIFAAGDCERGQSLVVWAIADGRDAANCLQEYFQQRL